MLTNRGKAAAAAGALVVAVLLAFVVARLTTHSGTPVAHQSTGVAVSRAPAADSATPTDTQTAESLSPDPTTSTSASVSISPSPSPSVSLSTSAVATPPPPLTVGQLVKQVTGCSAGACKVVKTFASSQSGTALRFVLVQLPVAKGAGEAPVRAALFDTKTQKLSWSSDVMTGVPANGADGGAAQDATGHIAFTLYVGMHTSNLYVFDPADGKNVKWFGQPNQDGSTGYFSDTPGAHAEDLDGDGVLEVVLPENDYTPDYATGNTTVFRYAWDSGKHDYVPAGCTYYPRSSKTGTDYDAGDPKCAAS
ncbi:MAG: hypothetical protein QOK14_1027 [Frankiaceae bacterium]|nr:hypothetical protein [Frankiaceae bacterium]